MAAALIENPQTPHTLEHDLESFFWVLIWAVVSFMPTSLTDAGRSNFLKDTMSPKVYGQCGRREKSQYLRAGDVPGVDCHNYISPLLRELKRLFAVQYPERIATPTPPGGDLNSAIAVADETEAPTKERCTEVEADNDDNNERQKTTEEGAVKKVSQSHLNHRVILALFRLYLEFKAWPKCDGAKPQTKIASQDEKRGMLAGSAQSRSRAEEIGVLVQPSTT
jgi:Fungal protein kinase